MKQREYTITSTFKGGNGVAQTWATHSKGKNGLAQGWATHSKGKNGLAQTEAETFYKV